MVETEPSRHQLYRQGPHREEYLEGRRRYRQSDKGRATAQAYRARARALQRFYWHKERIRRALIFGFTPEELAVDYNIPVDRIIKFVKDENIRSGSG